MTKHKTPRLSKYVCYIEKYDPCVGCGACVDACYYKTNADQRIKKMDPRFLKQHGHSAEIPPQTAIGELPLSDEQIAEGQQVFDYWPMIHPELCNGCGECIKACPDGAIYKIRRENQK